MNQPSAGVGEFDWAEYYSRKLATLGADPRPPRFTADEQALFNQAAGFIAAQSRQLRDLEAAADAVTHTSVLDHRRPP